MKRLLLLIPGVSLLLSQVAWAEMYRWVDENGVVTYKDTPPPQKKKRSKVKVYRDEDFAPAPPPSASRDSAPRAQTRKQARSSEKRRFSGTIEMFVTDWCPVCKRAESYLRSRNYPYVKYDIDKDEDARRRFQEMGGRGVPLILVGSQRLSGFSPQYLEQLMGNE